MNKNAVKLGDEWILLNLIGYVQANRPNPEY